MEIKKIDKCYVISCSTLQDEVYQYLNMEDKVKKFFIYCRIENRGRVLKISYEKIDSVYICPNKLIKEVVKLKDWFCHYMPICLIKIQKILVIELLKYIYYIKKVNWFILTCFQIYNKIFIINYAAEPRPILNLFPLPKIILNQKESS